MEDIPTEMDRDLEKTNLSKSEKAKLEEEIKEDFEGTNDDIFNVHIKDK